MTTQNSRRAPRFSARAKADKAGEKVGEIHIFDVIGDDWFGITAAQVSQALERLKAEGVKRLEVHVNSPGGFAFDGVAIYNALRRFEGEKVVFIDGLAASAASVVALAGDRIVVGEGAMVMIHNPWGRAVGEAEELRKEADKLDALRDGIVSLYANRTRQSHEDLKRWMDAETWMDAVTAKARGFATEIAGEQDAEQEPAESSAAASALFAQFKRAPREAARFLTLAPAAPKTAAGGKEKTMEKLLAKLGLAEGATEDEVLEKLEAKEKSYSDLADTVQKLQERSQALDKLLERVGANDVSTADAKIAGLQEKAARADELTEQLAAIEMERKQAEIGRLLDEATADGRLSPARREALTCEAAPSFAHDPTTLKVFLDMLPKPAPAPREPKVETPAKPWSEMSNVEKAELFRENPELAKRLQAEAEKK